MVNEKTDKIKLILKILKESGSPASGESLAEKLGVSRVAVWKIISGLKDRGYNIAATHSGYRLLSTTDKPVPWEFDNISGRIEYHDVLDSTMNKAARLIDSGCADGTIVIAGTQTAGKGTDGEEWKSPDGGLYFTRIRTLPFPAVYSGLYTVSIAAAAVRVLRKNCNIDANIQWPNSITAQGKKIGGVLTLLRGRIDMINSAAAGVGLNLKASGFLPHTAASVEELSGRSVSAKTITSALLESIESHDASFFTEEMLKEYKNYIGLIGKPARVRKPGGAVITGIVTDLHYSGCLLLKTAEDRIENIYSGDEITYEQPEFD